MRMPLDDAEQRYGAPYWVIHRGDLQAALATAASRQLGITIKLGVRAEDFVTHPNGVTVSTRGTAGTMEEHGVALIAADGLWSAMRGRLGHDAPPRFAGRTAWRGLIPAREVAPEFREPQVRLWLGRDAHLVHYPVKAGRIINVVVITADSWNAPGWSEPASRAEIVPRLAAEAWAPAARALVGLPEAWLKWALYDRQPIRRWSQGPVALLGDAAHPMLPYLAQGAAMAIEDAAVAAQCLARSARRYRQRAADLLRDATSTHPQRAASGGRATARATTLPALAPGCATTSCALSAEHASAELRLDLRLAAAGGVIAPAGSQELSAPPDAKASSRDR